MGDVIRRTAAADDIFSDVRRTSINASAKGGKWKELAIERLGNTLSLIDLIESRYVEASRALAPLAAAVNSRDQSADRFIGQLSDQVWNAAGRPGSDPGLAIIFPGGISAYTQGPDDEQPARMELLAELLETITVAKVDRAMLVDAAQQARNEAAAYRNDVEAARVPRARVRLLDRVRASLARSAQTELMHLKRLYKAAGFSEAEIHSVIPHRPRPHRGSAPNPAPPAAPGPTGPTPSPANPPA